MPELVFVGFGLGDGGITVKGLEEVKLADEVYIETHTNYTPSWVVERLEMVSGRRFRRVLRRELEDVENCEVLKRARRLKIVLLVPGDPFVATTHIGLRVEAEKLGVKTKVISSSSVVAAAAGACGLQSYRFGETATVVFPNGSKPSMKPYDTALQNLERGLHTLLLLDYRAEEGRAMTVNDGLKILRSLEARRGMGVFTDSRLVVGLARLGYESCKVKGGSIEKIVEEDFGEPPHCLVVPGRLHFMEVEALKVLAGVEELPSEPPLRFRSVVDSRRLGGYIDGVEKVFREMAVLEAPRLVDRETVNKALKWARNYYLDSVAFRNRGDLVSSLLAVAYCEGILEGLRLLKAVSFKWEGELDG